MARHPVRWWHHSERHDIVTVTLAEGFTWADEVDEFVDPDWFRTTHAAVFKDWRDAMAALFNAVEECACDRCTAVIE